jgi:hypothetical protein
MINLNVTSNAFIQIWASMILKTSIDEICQALSWLPYYMLAPAILKIRSPILKTSILILNLKRVRTERLSDLLTDTQLVSGRARIKTDFSEFIVLLFLQVVLY